MGGVENDKYGVDEVAYDCEAAEGADTDKDRPGDDGKCFADEVDREAGLFELPHLDRSIDTEGIAKQGQDEDRRAVV